MVLDARPRADPIDEALYVLRANGTFYCRSELTAPWGIEMPPMADCLWFHIVTAGRCLLTLDDRPPTTIRPGDFVLVPAGQGHCLQTDDGVACPDVTTLPQEMTGEHYSLLEYGGGGDTTTLVCGLVRLDHPRAYELVDLLPSVIHLDASSVTDAAWMESTLRLIAAEAKALRPGGETIITRLADVLVLQAVRAWLSRDSAEHPGWLRALHDPQIGRVVARTHREPESEWSVATMAEVAGMSRSGFSARFSAVVGESPMHYVTRVRMRVAQAELGAGHATAAELAGRLGYRSEAAFSRAFKRAVGQSPGAVKRAAKQAVRGAGIATAHSTSGA